MPGEPLATAAGQKTWSTTVNIPDGPAPGNDAPNFSPLPHHVGQLPCFGLSNTAIRSAGTNLDKSVPAGPRFARIWWVDIRQLSDTSEPIPVATWVEVPTVIDLAPTVLPAMPGAGLVVAATTMPVESPQAPITPAYTPATVPTDVVHNVVARTLVEVPSGSPTEVPADADQLAISVTMPVANQTTPACMPSEESNGALAEVSLVADRDIDPFARALIRKKAKQLVGRAGYRHQDREDIEQELALQFVRRLPSFDPGQGHFNVFATVVIERSVASILRHRLAKKRDDRHVMSLSAKIDSGEEGLAELVETIGQRELDARRGQHPRFAEELAQLKFDMVETIATLSAKDRELPERLKSRNVSEISRDIGVPRSTLDERVRRLRRRFEQAGMKDYI